LIERKKRRKQAKNDSLDTNTQGEGGGRREKKKKGKES